jgi:lysyl-tRNA synthetase class 2
MSAPGVDWRPAATLETLRLRARLLDRLRVFFAARGVLEVETPILSRAAATDPHLASFVASGTDPHDAYHLQTSPEYAMKRLLAAGAGPIYQVCKAFRADESGHRHNPEFTMVEWYRPGLDHCQLMVEVAELVAAVIGSERKLGTPETISYGAAFERHAGIDPHRASGRDLASRARALGLVPPASLDEGDLDGWRDLLLTQVVEPQLGRERLSFLCDFPASQAALARVRPGDPPLASRFEAYLDGMELANGFHELCDPVEQRRRFEQDLARRRNAGLPEPPGDERLLAALESGLPDCSGVALGFDRLVMAACGAKSISQVMAFPADRA